MFTPRDVGLQPARLIDGALADTARANTRLHQGEAHHSLKNALWIGRQGESCDRSSEGQRYPMAGLNLLAAIVIYCNTAHLGEAVRQRKHSGLTVEPKLLAQISPPGWAHILLTGEYRVAITPLTALAYDSALYRSRPEHRKADRHRKTMSNTPAHLVMAAEIVAGYSACTHIPRCRRAYPGRPARAS